MLNRKQAVTLTGILILVSIAIFLMSHQTPPETVVIYKAVEFTPKTETSSASHPNSDVEIGAIVNEDTDVSEPNTDDDWESTEMAQLLDELFFGEILDETEITASANEDSEEVAVSPHGFGPYPEIPSDYFRTPVWAYPDSEFSPGHELIDRVLIKLWKQGIYSKGGSIEDGRVYPIRRGTVYVKWKGDFISDYLGHPDDNDEQIISILENKGIPTGITVLDYDTAGIDPYQFLNL
ncbi:hypothetical protein F4Z98_05995 [Candidatus Poribacteria bacterium]|nr:hypothetical protein [Candidatus Poribacteria bacterium]MYB01769.1 hypothetical protein [Candidatus Poribacteria bacterium]